MARECEIVTILAARVARGDATAREHEQVEVHLRSCPACGKGRMRVAPRPRRSEPSAPVQSVPGSPESVGVRPLPKLPLAILGALIAIVVVVALVASPIDEPDEPVDDPAAADLGVAEPAGELGPAGEVRPAVELDTESAADGELGAERGELGAAEPTGLGTGPGEVDATPAGELDATTPAPDAGGPAAAPELVEPRPPAGDCGAFEGSAARESAPEARAAALLEAGDCWQAGGDPAAALRLYERVIAEHIDTPSAPAALFNKGVVCEALGKPGTATGAFADYRREFPEAPRLGEALFRLCRIHVAAGRTEQALSCLERYRRGYSGEAYVVDTHYLQGLALKDEPATRVAAADAFAAYIAGGKTEHLEDVLYWRAVSLKLAGDPRAAEAGRAFLERVGSGERAAEIRTWLP